MTQQVPPTPEEIRAFRPRTPSCAPVMWPPSWASPRRSWSPRPCGRGATTRLARASRRGSWPPPQTLGEVMALTRTLEACVHEKVGTYGNYTPRRPCRDGADRRDRPAHLSRRTGCTPMHGRKRGRPMAARAGQPAECSTRRATRCTRSFLRGGSRPWTHGMAACAARLALEDQSARAADVGPRAAARGALRHGPSKLDVLRRGMGAD